MTVDHDANSVWSMANGKQAAMDDHHGETQGLSKESRIKYIELGRKKLLEFKRAQESAAKELKAKEEQAAAGEVSLRQHEETLQQAVQQITALTAEVSARDQQLQLFSNELQQWHEQWQVVSAEMGNLQAGIGQRDATIAALQAELDQQKSIAARVHAKSKEELLGDLEDETFKLEEELHETRERAQQLQQEIQALNIQMQQEQSQKEVYRKLVEERDELIEKLSTHHSHNEDQELELQNLRMQLDQKEEMINRLQSEAQARDSQIVNLHHQEEEMQKTNEKLQTKVQQLTQDTETLVMQLTELKENRLEEKAMVDHMARQLEVATQQKAEVEKEVTNLKHHVAVLSAKSDFPTLGGGVSEDFLVEELEAARAQAHQLATDLYELQQKYDDESAAWTTSSANWEDEKEALRREIEELQQVAALSPSTSDQTTAPLPDRTLELLAELEQKERDRQEVARQSESKAAELDQLRNELVALQVGAAEIHLQLQESQQQIQTLRAENSTLHAQLSQKAGEDPQKTEQKLSELAAELKRAQEYNELLASTVQQLREELQQSQQNVQVMRPSSPIQMENSMVPNPDTVYPPVPLSVEVPAYPQVPQQLPRSLSPAVEQQFSYPEQVADVAPPEQYLSSRDHFLTAQEQAYAAQAMEFAAHHQQQEGEVQTPIHDHLPLISPSVRAAGVDPMRIPRPVSTKSTASFIPQHKTLFSVIIIQSILTFFTGKSWHNKKQESVSL